MMIGHVLELAHNKLGHNGISRMYVMLKRLYFWKGMKVFVTKHVKTMLFVRNAILKWSLMPNCILILLLFLWNLSVWILLVNFTPPPLSLAKYTLTVICMLTGYVFCIPLKSKQANEVLQAYIDNVYAKFSGLLKILSDNGTEFKNRLFEQIAKELGVKHKIYTAPYYPSSNGRIKGFYNFLKACIAKHISSQLG